MRPAPAWLALALALALSCSPAAAAAAPYSGGFYEERWGGYNLSNHTPPRCACCDKQYNETPVRLGMVLQIANINYIDKECRYGNEAFLRFVNVERGGLCMGGQRRPVEIVVLDDLTKPEAAQAAAVHLHTKRGINLFLAPRSSRTVKAFCTALLATDTVIVTALANTDDVLHAFPNLYGISQPASQALAATFDMVRGRVKRVGSIVDVTSDYALSSCSQVPTFAKHNGMTMVANVSLSGDFGAADDGTPSADMIRAVRALKAARAEHLAVCLGIESDLVQLVKAMKLVDYNPFSTGVSGVTPSFYTSASNDGRFLLNSEYWRPDITLFKSTVGMDAPITAWDWTRKLVRDYNPETKQADDDVVAVSYRAAYCYVAAQVLVEAVEAAQSTASAAVRRKLTTNKLVTIIGRINMSEDGINDPGFVADLVNQMPGEGSNPQLVWPREAATMQAILPQPLWANRDCHSYLPVAGWNGYYEDTCDQCDAQLNLVASWFNTTRTRNCTACPTGKFPFLDTTKAEAVCQDRCDIGQTVNLTSKQVVKCAAGTEGRNGSNCICFNCTAGRYNAVPGSSCSPCRAGTYAERDGLTACTACPKGKVSGDISPTCQDCSRGMYTKVPGSSSCILCQPGWAAVNQGSSECLLCEPGKYSEHGNGGCVDCPIGKYGQYQKDSNGSGNIFGVCLDGPPGAALDQPGQTIGPNKDGFFLRRAGVGPPVWERCEVHPDACIFNLTCAPGSTGDQCSACLPGYASSPLLRGIACFKCPPAVQNVIMTLVVLLGYAVTALILGSSAAGAARRIGLDFRLMLLKLLYLYAFLFSKVGSATGRVLMRKEGQVNAFVVKAVAQAMSAYVVIQGGAFVSESPLWSVSCLAQPAAPEILAQTLSQTEWLTAVRKPYRKALHDFQLQTEVRTLVFWVVFPIGVVLASYLLGMAVVAVRLLTKRHFYRGALDFMDVLHERGIDAAVGRMPFSRWNRYVAAHDERVAGLWNPLAIYKALSQREFGMALRHYHHDGVRPLLGGALFVAYGAALYGVLRPLRCETFQEGSSARRRIAVASTVMCRSSGEAGIAVASMVLGIGWGVLLPAALSYAVHRETAHADSLTAVMVQGYKREFSHWEAVAFLIKFLLAASDLLDIEGRCGMLLLLTFAFMVLHAAMQPFQESFDDMPKRLVTRMGTVVCAQSYVAFYIAGGFGESSIVDLGLTFAVCVTVLADALILLQILFVLKSRTVEALFLGMDLGEFAQDEAEGNFRGNLLVRIAGAQYRRHVQDMPYVCFDHTLGWVRLCGSRGDVCEAPVSLPELDDPPGEIPDLSSASKLPLVVADPTRPTATHLGMLQKALMHTVGHLAVLDGSPTFSTTLIEFAMRASFVLARGLERQVAFSRGSIRHPPPKPPPPPASPKHSPRLSGKGGSGRSPRSPASPHGKGMSEASSTASHATGTGTEQSARALARRARTVTNLQLEQVAAEMDQAAEIGDLREAVSTDRVGDLAVGVLGGGQSPRVRAETAESVQTRSAMGSRSYGSTGSAHMKAISSFSVPDVVDFEHEGVADEESYIRGLLHLEALMQREMGLRHARGKGDSARTATKVFTSSPFWRDLLRLQYTATRYASRNRDQGLSRSIMSGLTMLTYMVESLTAQVDDSECSMEERERVMHRLLHMFDPLLYETGVTIEMLIDAMGRLRELNDIELRLWLDLFEDHWVLHKVNTLHHLRSYAGEEVDKADITSASIQPLTRVQCRWVRMVLLRLYDPPGSAPANDAGSIGQLLKVRRARQETREQAELAVSTMQPLQAMKMSPRTTPPVVPTRRRASIA